MTPNALRPAGAALVLTLLLAAAPAARAGTRYAAQAGTDTAMCGLDLTTACRSISRAIALASPGDTILVAPGIYGDLNRNGTIGETGEETGSPGCGCVLSINKRVFVASTGGAAVTTIDGRSVNVQTNVLLITIGGEFGRPGKGFTVTETIPATSFGIAIDSSGVLVRGNFVIYTNEFLKDGIGIVTVNDEPIRIEGNLVSRWQLGIAARGAALVSRNQVTANQFAGIQAEGATVTGNVVAGNGQGINVFGNATISGNTISMQRSAGVVVQPTFSGSITKNNLLSNGPDYYNCGVYNAFEPNVKATGNYWGVATGPGAPPANTVCDSYAGSTNVAPFSTKPFAVKVLKP